MTRPSRDEAETLVGKRTALPGGDKQRGGNFVPSKARGDSSASKEYDFKGLTNPNRTAADREIKMAGGGKVRGQGIAMRTKVCKMK